MMRRAPFFGVLTLSCLCFSSFGQSAEDFSGQAARLVERNQPLEAVQLLRQGLELHPDSTPLLVTLGGLLTSLGKVEEGDQFLRRALAIDPHNVAALRESGEAKIRQGNLEAAKALFEKALWHGSTDAVSHQRLAFALFLQGKEAEALEHQRQAVAIKPFDAGYRRFFSSLLDVEGDPEAAYQQLLMAFRLDPTDAPTLGKLGRLARRRGNLSQALEFVEIAADLDPESPLYQNQLADYYQAAGVEAESLAARGRAADLEKLYQAYADSISLVRQGQVEKAASDLETAMQGAPPFPTGLLLQAELQRRLGHKDAALKLYLRVLELDPQRTAAREEGAWLQVNDGALQSAIELLRGSQKPSVNQALLEGYDAMLREDWDLALEKFEGVLAENPLTPPLLELVGRCLSASGRSEEALQVLRKASTVQPGDPEIAREQRQVRFDKATAYQDRREWRKALQLYAELQREESGEAAYFLNAAYCRQRLGDWEGAVGDYRRGLQLDPGQSWALVNLASSLYRLSRFEESLKEWRRVSSAGLGGADAHLQQGLCLSHLGRDPEAEVAFERALRAGVDSPELIYNLGVTRLRLMKVEGAWALIRRAADRGYPPALDLLRKARLGPR